MLEGRSLMEVFPATTVERLKPFYDTALSGQTETFSYSSRERHYEVTTLPLSPGDAGEVRGMLVIRETTQQQEALEAQTRHLESIRHLLRQANEEVEHFLRHAAHDLRAPLRQIDGFTEFLVRDHGEKLDEDGRELLSLLQRSAQRMRHLLDDLLDLARAGGTAQLPQPVDLSPLLRDLLEDLPTAGVTISIEELPVVWGEHVLVRLLFQNLLENALRYRSPDRPLQIRIAAAWVDEGWAVSVADTGVGIAPEHLSRIFLPFERFHRNSEGSGLGLATCSRIVTRQKGHITVESTLGRGSTFTVLFRQPPP